MDAYRVQASPAIFVLVLGTAIFVGCHGENGSTIDPTAITDIRMSSSVAPETTFIFISPTVSSAITIDNSGLFTSDRAAISLTEVLSLPTSLQMTFLVPSTVDSTLKLPQFPSLVQTSTPIEQTQTTTVQTATASSSSPTPSSLPPQSLTNTVSLSSSVVSLPTTSGLPSVQLLTSSQLSLTTSSSNVFSTSIPLTTTSSMPVISATNTATGTPVTSATTPATSTALVSGISTSTSTPQSSDSLSPSVAPSLASSATSIPPTSATLTATSTPPAPSATMTNVPTDKETVVVGSQSSLLTPVPSLPSPSHTMTTTATPTPSSGTSDGIAEKISAFFRDIPKRTEILVSVTLGPVVVILLVVVVCVGCCCLCSRGKKHRKRFDLTSQDSTTRNGVSPIATYRPSSRMSLNELRQYENDAFNSDYRYQTSSQPYYSTTAISDSAFVDPLPSISPLSYPSQLRNYMHPEKQEHPTPLPAHVSLSGSPGALRRFPGGSPSLHHRTPLGEQLKKQAEKSSTQGSRNSIQGSRASISAMGSRTSFSGSRNSFLSGSNTMSRDEMRSSGFLRGSKSEEETSSLLSSGPLLRRTSLDVVPTRQSPIQPTTNQPSKRRECRSMTCIPNPLALKGEEGMMEGMEEGDAEDENDLRTDPLVPVMTSTPVNQREEDFPTKEVTQRRKGDESQKAESSRDLSLLTSPRRRNLQQLTSLARHKEGGETDGVADAAPKSSGAVGGGKGDEEDLTPKEEKPKSKPMSRLEKLTSLDYIRSSIRRSLKKKRVSFLTRTPPETTPKAKKKTPPRNLPGVVEPDLEPDPLTFSNQGAFDPDEVRIHTPSPLSPEFEGVDESPQRYPDDFYNPDVYQETPVLHHPYPGLGAGSRGRAYSDLPMFAPQLSQPAYYPSTMHHPQHNYPQLSQQYMPPSYYPPQPVGFVGSPTHRSLGPLHQPPVLLPPSHPTEPYGRRYTAEFANPRMGGAKGGSEQSSNHHHKTNRARSPDVFTDTASNVSSRYNYGTSPDRYMETPDFRVHSPDVYAGMAPGRDGYHDMPLRFRSVPTSPEERPYSPQYHPLPGGNQQHRDHTSSRAPQYTEHNPRVRKVGTGSQVQSPTHHPPYSAQHRRSSIEHHPNHIRHSSNDTTPNHVRGSNDASAHHTRRGSNDTAGNHVRQGSNDAASNHVRRGSNDTATGRQVRHDTGPNHARRGSNDATGNQVRRGSIDTHPSSAGNSRRSSIDSQPPTISGQYRHSSIDGYHQPSGSSRRTSTDGYHGAQNMGGFHTIREPGLHRNGIEVDEVWQHSQREDQLMQYGMGSQYDRMGLPVWDDPTRGHTEREVDSGTSNAKAKVSWNNEIIEHLRTPSDCSEN